MSKESDAKQQAADAIDTFLRQTRRGERIELVGADGEAGWSVWRSGSRSKSLPRIADADAVPALHPAKRLAAPTEELMLG
jgi:hypothetical protein